MKTKTIWAVPATLCLAVLFGSACARNQAAAVLPSGAAPSLVTSAGDLNQFLTLNSLALLPITYDSKLRLVREDVRERAERGLEESFRREVDLKFLSAEEVRKKLPPIALASRDAAELGRRLNVDGVLITTVHQLMERDGSALGSDRPAAVDFTMRLVRSSNGAEIWRASYHFKDEPLSENLFRINSRLDAGALARFQSAHDMLSAGFASAGRDLAEARQGSFQR